MTTMTPLDEIQKLHDKKNLPSWLRLGAAFIGLLGVFFMFFVPMLFGTTFYFWWISGIILAIPNWLISARDWIINAQISNIINNETIKASEEKYGRKEA